MFNSKSNVLIWFMVFVVGFISGWLLKTDQAIDAVQQSADSPVAQLDQIKKEPSEISVKSNGIVEASQSDNTPDLFQEAARDRARRAIAYMQALEQKIADEPLNPVLKQELGRFLESYFESSARRGEIPAFIYISENHPLLLQQSLELLTADLSSPDAQKKYMRFITGLGLNDAYRNAERLMLAKVESGESIDKWFGWAASYQSFRLQLPETGKYMLGQLPSLTDPTNISIAVRAIANPEGDGKRYLNAHEKTQFERMLTPLFDSDDASLRARAVSTLGQVLRSDTEQLLLKSLADPAKIVRDESYLHLANNEIHDRAIVYAVMANVRDSSLKMDERQFAMRSLESSNRVPDLDEQIRELRQELDVQEK